MKWLRNRAPAPTTYHYRLQAERRLGGWVNPVDHRTGVIVDGCHGIVEATENDLAAIGAAVLERSGGSWVNCRVVFAVGARGPDEVLKDEDVFGIVTQPEHLFVPGPAHPRCPPGTRPFDPQPTPLGERPWQDHGLVDHQMVECGCCGADITVYLSQPGEIVLATKENTRSSALICGGCGRLLCVDCLSPAIDVPFADLLTCDRCGANVGPPAAPEGSVPTSAPRPMRARKYEVTENVTAATTASATASARPVEHARKYADHTATEVIDCVIACRRAGLGHDRTVQRILDELRREYGHPAYPFAASLERLAYGTAGPPLYQESMEPDEVDVVDTIVRRLTGNGLTLDPSR